MNNIVLVGLIYDTNLGDRAIYFSTKHMMSEVLKERGLTDIELRGVDMVGRDEQARRIKPPALRAGYAKLRIKYGIQRLLIGQSKAGEAYKDDKFKIRSNYLCRKYIDNETIGIIFVGGGLIKFGKTQNLSGFIDGFVEYADQRNIPVMFSAVGIEGYDDSYKECRDLQNALNRECVRMITTRDDLELLRAKYMRRKDIVTDRVADPVCSINKYYRAKTNNSKKRIGISCVRKGLFEEYGIDFNAEAQKKLFIDVIGSLRKKGYECALICNGARSDMKTAYSTKEEIEASGDHIELKDRPRSTTELIDQITGFDAVISCRLHAGIIAYSYNIPCVELVWNNKQKLFGKMIGYPERFISEQDFDAEYIVSAVEKAMSEGYDMINKEDYCQTTKKYLGMFVDMIKAE